MMTAVLTAKAGSRLNGALDDLRKIEDRRQVIVCWDEAQLSAIREIIDEAQTAACELSEAERRQDVAGYKKSLRDYADARLRGTVLEGMVIEGVRQSSIDRGRIGLLKGKCPDLKTVLIRAIESKIEVVKEHADTVFAQESEQLAKEDFDEDQIKNSPRCKRAFGLVRQWEAILQHVATSPIEETWTSTVGGLLSDEQAT